MNRTEEVFKLLGLEPREVFTLQGDIYEYQLTEDLQVLSRLGNSGPFYTSHKDVGTLIVQGKICKNNVRGDN